MDWLIDTEFWQPILAFLALLAIIVPIILYVLTRKKKKFSYDILSNNRITLHEDKVGEDLMILYNGEPVTKVYLNVIRLINNGNVEIKAEDFHEKIKINFGKSAYVLNTECIKGIETTLNAEGNSVILEPNLFNKGDYIDIKTLVSNFENLEDINIKGHIVGVKEISEYKEHIFWRLLEPLSLAILLIFMGLFIGSENPVYMLGMLFGILLFFSKKYLKIIIHSY